MRPLLGIISSISACMSGVASGASVEADAAVPSMPDALTWEERLGEREDPGLFAGYLSQPRRVAPGYWGSDRLRADAQRGGRLSPIPGEAPLLDGGQVQLAAQRWLASGPWSIHGFAEVVRGFKDDPTTIDPSTGTDLDLPNRLLAIDASVAVNAWGETISAGTEPVQWGEGIFGSPVLTRQWRGFPHLSLTPTEPNHLGDPGDEPLLLHYELIGGALDGSRTGPEWPIIAGVRSSLRWEGATLSATYLGLFESGHGDDGAPGEDHEDIAAAALALAGDDIQARGEIALGDWTTQWPTSTAWTVTLDWIAVGGDPEWRTALEWYRSTPGFSSAGRFGRWDYRGIPLGHPDGDDAESVRWLVQHADDSLASGTVLGWRRTGRSAEGAWASGVASPPPRAWDAILFDAWARWSWSGWWIGIDANAELGHHREFLDDGWRWSGGCGAEAGLRW
jgi:hypothetical protein